MLACAGSLASVLVASGAAAQDRTSAFAGGFVSSDYFAYAGATVPLPGAQSDRGWAIRAVVSAGAYEYERSGSQIDADYVNVEAAFVYQRSGAWGYLNLGAGPRYSTTDLSQPDPINAREGDQLDVVIAADGARNIALWRVAGFTSYGFNIEDYYARGEVTRALRPGGVRLGIEGVLEGDPSYDRQSIGAVLAFQPVSGSEVRFSLGSRSGSGDRSGEAYFAIGASRSF